MSYTLLCIQASFPMKSWQFSIRANLRDQRGRHLFFPRKREQRTRKVNKVVRGQRISKISKSEFSACQVHVVCLPLRSLHEWQEIMGSNFTVIRARQQSTGQSCFPLFLPQKWPSVDTKLAWLLERHCYKNAQGEWHLGYWQNIVSWSGCWLPEKIQVAEAVSCMFLDTSPKSIKNHRKIKNLWLRKAFGINEIKYI